MGWLLVPLAASVTGLGFWLGRRYGAAIRHEGIGRPYPFWQSALAFLGDGLVIVGLIGLVIAMMFFF